ncbi:MAG: hypothetical protein ACFFDK_00110 [Promethearchaeota archaeon]
MALSKSKFLTESKNLNIAIISLIILDLIMMIMGLLYVILGTFQTYHVDYIGMSASRVRSFNPKLMNLISMFIRMIGFGFLSVSIGGLIILFTGFKNKEKWGWMLYLFQHLMLAIPLMWITYVVGGLSLILVIIGWILLIIGIMFSYKEFFR